MNKIKELLDREVEFRNCDTELSFDKPDPLMIAKKYNDEYVSLLCALFAYGKASLIVKFLGSLDFALLDSDEDVIKKALANHYYRFQTSKDVIDIFIALRRMKHTQSLNECFLVGYNKNGCVLEGFKEVIEALYKLSDSSTNGFGFLVGGIPFYDKFGKIETKNISPYKRWNMFARWMIRCDCLDMGLWSGVDKKDLILPLDTHTFEISKKMKLLNRSTYDLKSAVLITEKLREFDKDDPIKYDFALYRLGQEKIDFEGLI